MTASANVDEYIASYPEETREMLREDLDEVPAVGPYLSGRGTAKFPLGEVPYAVIEDVVRMLQGRRDG